MRITRLSLFASSLVIFTLLIALLPSAYSTEVRTVTVDPGYIQTLTLNLQSGAQVTISLSITGGSGDDIDFWVTDPDGDQIISKRRVQSGGDFDFRASENGAYTLHLDNSFSVFSSKQVRISYNVNNPIIPTGGGGGGGCLIATAAFGSELTPQVQFLRNFRDNQILATASGTSFMTAFNSWYYSFSPAVADYERQQPWLQQTVRIAIYPLLGILQASEMTYSVIPGEYGSIAAGMIASSLIGAVYVSPLALSIGKIRKYRLDYRIAITIITAAALSVLMSLIAANEVALTVTTPLLVLSTLIITAILSANKISAILINRRNRLSSDIH